jgi:hypothetical protein
MTTPRKIPEHLADYRKVLVTADQKAQEELDKAILSLSGGGLGVSMVFIKDIIGTAPIDRPWLLMAAWIAWGLSVVAVLASYHLSIRAIHNGIAQIDAGNSYAGEFGGAAAKATLWLNWLGIALFFAGVVCISAFVCFNIATKGVNNGNPPAIASSGASTSASAASTADAASTRASTAEPSSTASTRQ